MYLVPANTKKSVLIFGFMKGIDACIAAGGLLASVIGLVAIGDRNSTLLTIIVCLPGVIAGLLILPIPNYHNTRVALLSIIRYYRERRNYIWRGWCIYDEYRDDK